MNKNVEAALPWALIGAASLGMFACTSSGTTRAYRESIPTATSCWCTASSNGR